MRLHYYQSIANFGDRLNPWLWPQLLPGCFDETDDTLFLGIGTILQAGLPAAKRYVVLGSGTGYGEAPPLDSRWQFLAVRGPLTARALQLPTACAVTDAAYLLRLVEWPAPAAGESIGFMPHWRSLRRVPWRSICARSGVRFIDPLGKVERVLAQLRGCDAVITEAMHGAIVADVMRIPWLPVRLGAHFLDFKWRDWLASIEVDCEPLHLTAMDPWWEHQPTDGPLMKTARRGINLASYYLRSLPLIAQLRALRRSLERGRQRGFLSTDHVIQQRTDTLTTRLQELRQSLPQPAILHA